MSMPIAKRFLLLALLFVFFCYARGDEPSWSFHNRLQAGLEYDGNVTEEIEHPQSAASLRFIVESKGYRRGKRLSANLVYRGGLQLYRDFYAENKLANEARLGLRIKLSPRVSFGVENWGRLKIFLNRDIDYALGYLRPYVSATLSPHLSTRTGISLQALNFAKYNVFNYRSLSIFSRFYWSLTKWLIVSPRIQYTRFNLNRRTYRVASDKSFWFIGADNQSDRTTSLGLQIDYYRHGLLVDVSYRYDTNRSNSYGAGYDRHVFVLSLARQISAVTMRLYATVQKKNYLDDLLPFWPQFLDTDEENTNFIILDLSWPLGHHTIFSLRTAWYHNESPYAALYYEKSLLRAIFEFAF